MAISSDSPSAAAADKPAEQPAKPDAVKTETPTQTRSADADTVNPPDFAGSVLTDNQLPSPETLQRIADLPVLDRTGKSHPFRSLYEPEAPHQSGRVLVLFVRHFFCGNCQEYLRVVSKQFPPAALAEAGSSAGAYGPPRIVVVGCGEPPLIDFYAETSECPYPIYADPTRRLYDELGMVSTLALGAKGSYLNNMSFARMVLRSIGLTLMQVPKGLVNKGGNQRQVGGEFIFETAPVQGETSGKAETKVTWCHRMKTTRDHAEMDELREVLGLPDKKKEEKEEKKEEENKDNGNAL